MSNRLRAFRRRAGLPSSGSRARSSPTALDLVFASLQGRALPGSLGQQPRKVDGNETSAPALSPIERDIWQSPSRPNWRRLDFLARRVIGAVTASLRRWRERARDRQYLRGLSDRDLKDLGLTRAQVESDFSKSHWRE